MFVSGVISFTLVAALMAIAEAATPSLTQAVVAAAVDGESRVRTMAILRSTRNVGFSVGAVLAAPLIAAGPAFAVIMFGDALSFVIVAVALARLPITRAAGRRPRAAGLVRDWRYAGLAAVNGVLTLHMTILAFGLPLWLLRATSAPASLVAGLLLINTIMAVILQVPFSKHAATTAGATRTLRLAGVMLAGCSVAMAAAAHTSRWLAVTALVLATMLLSLGEIWQASGAWELSYRYADPAREVQYLAVFSLGGTAQDVAAPALITGVVIAAGPGRLDRPGRRLPGRGAAGRTGHRSAGPRSKGAAVLRARGLTLYEPADIDGVGDLRQILTWAVEFLNAPHSQLGRGGPVCPYTRGSMDQNTFLLARAGWDSIESTIEEYRQWFLELLDQSGPLTILVVLPGLDRTDPGHLDELQARLKDSFVAEGLMIGQFHPRCEQGGLWNQEFRPLRSPIPLLAIRQMVSSDLPFLLGSSGHLAAYLHRFAPGIPGHARRLLVARASP